MTWETEMVTSICIMVSFMLVAIIAPMISMIRQNNRAKRIRIIRKTQLN